MKKYFVQILAIAVLVMVGACENSDENSHLSPDLITNPASASAEKGNEKMAKMVFDQPEQEFGTIVQGESAKMTYTFKNEGEVDLIISSANGSCGCTVPEWPKRPIKPGESNEITVVFNSQGKKGKQTKKVYITANTYPANNVIMLKGDVVAPE